MVMFIIGFFTAWSLLAIFCYWQDGRQGGICLFDGWATKVLVLPCFVFILPFEIIHEKIKKHLTK